MSEINLLPIDLSPSKGSAKTATTLKKAIVILFSLLLISVITGIGVILFFTSQVQSISSEENITTQKIESLQATEQTLFILKDRVSKIKIADSNTQISDAFNSIKKATSNLPQNVSVSTVDISDSATLFSIISKDSLGMATFLNSLVTGNAIKNLNIKSFDYNTDTGYTLKFQTS